MTTGAAPGFRGLRIALVGPLPPPAGGMATLTEQLSALLRAEGAVVDLVQVNAPYRPAWGGRIKGLRAIFRLLPYLRNLWCEIGRVDLVHVMANSGWSWHLFAAPALRIAAWRGVPVVVNFHGGEADQFLARAAATVRRNLRPASALLVPSGFLVDVFKRHGVDARILPNVVDLVRFHPDASRVAEAHRPQIIIARNLEHIYGIDIGLRAFAKVCEIYPLAQLSITGDGDALDGLRQLAQQLGIAGQVCFTGRLGRDEMAALYRRADVLLNPSRADNMPGAVLEAMASRVPVVATAVGGVPYLVEHERSAMLVPVDNPDALAEAAISVLRCPALSARLTDRAAQDVTRYDWGSVRSVLLQEYGAALAANAAPGSPMQTDCAK